MYSARPAVLRSTVQSPHPATQIPHLLTKAVQVVWASAGCRGALSRILPKIVFHEKSHPFDSFPFQLHESSCRFFPRFHNIFVSWIQPVLLSQQLKKLCCKYWQSLGLEMSPWGRFQWDETRLGECTSARAEPMGTHGTCQGMSRAREAAQA
jgi:hypothetical protein